MKHPTLDNAHEQFDVLYGGSFPNFEELFTDDTFTVLRTDAMKDRTGLWLHMCMFVKNRL